MKKAIVLVMFALFLTGCSGAAKQSEFWEHDTMYKNWDHTKFSWSGYKNLTEQDKQESNEQRWWGIEVPVVPGE
mgnify:CR=1 FL=1